MNTPERSNSIRVQAITGLAMFLGIFASHHAARAVAFPPSIELSYLMEFDGTEGFTMIDANVRELAGGVDLNNDGIEDLLVETPSALLVVFGRTTFPPELSLSGPGILQFVGAVDDFAAGGDFNGDGIDDLVVVDDDVYVVFGGPQLVEGDFDVADLRPENGGDGTLGSVVTSTDHPTVRAAIVGDINDDGRDDLFVGSNSDGDAIILYGQPDPQPALIELVDFPGTTEPPGFMVTDFGAFIFEATGLDLNVDGVTDLAMGSANVSLGMFTLEGRVMILYGQSGPFPRTLSLQSLLVANGGDGSEGVVINGSLREVRIGSMLDATGDLDGDGNLDLVIGNSRMDTGSSPDVYIVYSTDVGFGAEIDAGSIGASGLGAIVGDGSSDRLGFRIATGGDIDGDGVDDLTITDPTDSVGNSYCYVVYGAAGGQSPSINAGAFASGNGAEGVEVNYFPDVFSGMPECPLYTAISDMNGDSLADFAFGEFVVFGREFFDPSADYDADGVVDLSDNCVTQSNADQRDTDGDGHGNRCDPDFEFEGAGFSDCMVNTFDLGQLKLRFFSTDADADFNGDGIVNAGDLGIMKTRFFKPPGPSAAGDCTP